MFSKYGKNIGLINNESKVIVGKTGMWIRIEGAVAFAISKFNQEVI